MTRPSLFLLLAALATTASAQTSGTIDDDSPRWINDKPHDAYTVDLDAGDELTVVMTSEAFDTYLYLNAPSGRNIAYNDDCTEGDYNKSCLMTSARAAGTYEIIATVFDAAERGAYEIELRVNGEPVQ